MNSTAERASLLMACGGDGRILLEPSTGLNRYHSAPRPRDILAYASSTANDISEEAFAHVEELAEEMGGSLSGPAYGDRLEQLRRQIRSAYAIAGDVEIVFAPSGTDLEYVALGCAAGRAANGIQNILIGADEVGSGCIHSAHGRYFARKTALGLPVTPEAPVPGFGNGSVETIDFPVRDQSGHALPSGMIVAKIDEAIAAAALDQRHALIHVVHGSKTGLILPALADLDGLLSRHGENISFVVDACQARITPAAINAYLDRNGIVFVTGSKFMGAPPFSGFALVPQGVAALARPLAEGFATIFRRSEWPRGWPGADQLPDDANIGLLLRLEAAIFELERFQALGPEEVGRVVLAFHQAVRSAIVERLGIRRVAPYPPGDRIEADRHPIEMRTLSTLDLSTLNGGASLDDALHWHRRLVERGIRLGQPVKCVRTANGAWGATLRIGLSMPMIVERARLADDSLGRSFEADMEVVADAILACAA
ncbi:hypothetical protein [Sphingosinicella rhizophila]|uniref:Selenocysteine lyase/cysteine desulfurase n=1 Tax=Sphingosinicella rhizophila TaxID=3050082 RepID=A0ABU3Q3E6_9SPHN|nr:hypothetical protein [Sphingosinicella sp. GR2756]MDT9597935.1 hypothetical protein [Sphingosinicella sp. GR2756]